MFGWAWATSYVGLLRSLGTYLKFQIVAKAITLAIAGPIMFLATEAFVRLGNEKVVTQANLVPFLLSWRGAAFAAVLMLVLVIGFVVEINGLVTISARRLKGLPEAQYRSILWLGMRRVRNLLGWALPVVLLYLAVIAPLTGNGVTLERLSKVKIPNFITSVIYSTPKLLVAYSAVLVLLAIIGAFLSFTFHFIVLADQNVTRAMLNSVQLVARRRRRFLRFLAETVALLSIVAVVVIVWFALVLGLLVAIDVDTAPKRMLFIGLWLIQQSVLGLAAILLAPSQIHALTETFYESVAADEKFADLAEAMPALAVREKPSVLDRLFGKVVGIAVAFVLVIVAISIPGGFVADKLLRSTEPVAVIGHRAGGQGTPENSMSGLKHAIKHKAWGVEIDIQRTKDGRYVLNHDDTFKRAAGDPRKSTDMTAAQIAKLDIDPRPNVTEAPPTLEEFLDAAKGHVTVFIELKGATADKRMAADVLKLVKERDMLGETVIISLNYQLIRDVEKSDPNVQTGYLYFLALGRVSELEADYLILEEGEATPSRLVEIINADKRAIVWTVNEQESMSKFGNQPVYAMITDHIEELNKVLEEREFGSDVELFLKLFVGVAGTV
ncbi:glycerophosphoryl diester phosphodiesterase membrane domain-containing protein [Enemella sp. A6]|uniref:glycerophosphoryl diester phosphodiesterase membrane domain-containing protein n=1 Tax=Enemella sp. A6 TaxID=3440152 RepID=UPI003EBF84B3